MNLLRARMTPLVLLLLASLLLFVSCQTPDRARLNRFFEVTGGHHMWINNTHWNTTKPICSWFGVQCHDGTTTEDSGVVNIFLPSNSLVGRVPKILYEIPSLKVLDLKDNSLTDGGFHGLTKDSMLEKLDLSQNGLTSMEGIGNAPDSLRELQLGQNRISNFRKEVTSLHKLESLIITKNKLRGTLPTAIGKMTGLTHLNAYDNLLSGPVPSQIGLLTKLKLLSLAQNAFTGTIPTTVNNMKSLRTFSLHNQEGLHGPLPHFQGIPEIKEVYLDDNELTGSIPHKFLWNATSKNAYIHIGLANNQLTGTIPPELERFSSMQLNLAGNEITHIPNQLCNMKKWMGGAVEQYGCDAILCPNGTSNKDGRQITDEDPCEPCPAGTGYPYLGATTCSENDDAAVIQILFHFYNKLQGSNWKEKKGWEQFDSVNQDTLVSASIDPCSFHGVDCIFNAILGIELPNNGLVGTIPASVFELPHLGQLDVSRNAVTMTHKGFKALGEHGTVTQLTIGSTQTNDLEGIGLLKSVLILDIGGLDIEGPIPNELFELTNVHEIHAQFSKFSGPLPTLIGNLGNLTRLSLFSNKLTGRIPTEIGRLTSLRLLDLAENSFTGKLPTEMARMTSLHKLRLHQSNSTLTGTLPAFDTFPNLVELLLDANNFTGTIPTNFLAGINEKTEHISIDLRNNALEGNVPSSLEDFLDLTIHLEGNKISSIAPELCAKGKWMDGDVGQVGSCDAILCPNGTWNAYGRASFGAACEPCASNSYYGSISCGDDKDPFPEKRILDNLFKKTGGIHWTTKRNWTDNTVGICFREGITCGQSSDVNSGVTEVRIVANNMGGHIPTSIFQLPSLRVLDFSDNEVDLEFLHINKATKLEELRMTTTDLTSVSGIHHAPSSLRELYFSNNRLSGAIPSELLNLSGIKKLFLSNNYFNETIPSSIASLSSIEVLDLSQNDMTGHLPTELGSLSKLEELNLSENLLSGALPSEFGLLKSLRTLSLALQNKLSGRLLPFNTNPSLTTIDLSHNSLKGTIPSNFLSAVDGRARITVDLSYNKITGGIPSGLDSLEFLDIDLSANRIDILSETLCDENNADWMDGNVGYFNTCDAILCRPGFATANGKGRQVDADSPCDACPGGEQEAPYYGSTTCTLSVIEIERETLGSLYQLTNGPNWLRQTNWMSEQSVCTWYGVTCVDDEIIVALELPHNNLEGGSDVSGLVSDLLFSLQNLVTLDLRGNDIPLNFNRIPAEAAIQTLKLSSTGLKTLDGIGGVKKLRKLEVSNNFISDTIPDELYTLTQLESIYLSFNWFSGTLSTWIGRLSNLSGFFVDSNDLSGTLPSEIGLVSTLSSLVLTDNLFSGSIPAELGGLQKLQLFSCARSRKPGPRLSGTLPALDRLPALTSLYLNHNDLSGSIPSTFISASPLASFVFLGDNFLSDAVPLELDSIPAVYLQLEENHISGFPNQFCNNSHWMGGSLGRVGCDAFLCPPGTASPIGRANDTVTCESCSSSDAARYYGSTSCDAVSSEQKILLRLYQRCGGIEWYQKDGWAADSKGICEWYGVTCHADGHVKSIDLSANNLVNQPPWEIFELPRLESLVLSSNPIVDFSFVGIERARRLTELRLDAIGLSSLEGLEQGVGLTKLNLRFNNLQGAFPTEILALKNLRELNLADNRIESQLPSFSDLTRLQTLRLGSNGFTGPLPSFNDMVVLTTIDLSFNRLSGSIPEDFLNRLSSSAKVHVDLASNQLTGGLPQDLHRFETMTIYLRDNRINELSDEFCEKSKWNGGDVDHFGCNAILCPPGTATAIGRQSMARIESPCARCENRNFEYYGMTDCEPESSSASTVGNEEQLLARYCRELRGVYGSLLAMSIDADFCCLC